MKFWCIIKRILLLVVIAFLLASSSVSFIDVLDQARQLTVAIEFDYIAWTLTAAAQKIGQVQLGAPMHISSAIQRDLVLRYFALIRQLEETQAQIQIIYANPQNQHPELEASALLSTQGRLETALNAMAPLAESILEWQVSQVLEEQGIGFLAQTIPPVLFHSTPLPKALIISPRNSINQEVNLSLLADLSLRDISTLENRVESTMNMSALVVDVGGIGVYPTMVERYSDMRWTIDTITHEWAHNYLTLHPLGLNYDTNSELRTMNETAASIVGTEISALVLDRFYPQVNTRLKSRKLLASFAPPAQTFDFRHEMHLTRVKVDTLLSEGKIEEAEQYMEERRVFFVQQGYIIRKLNQAYFAFYGAYAEQPGGAAGTDPVGPAVRELRARTATLSDFLRQIARMNSFSDLRIAIGSSVD